MAKKREVELAKRDLELKLAAMNMNKDRGVAADRRSRMVHESNVGLPGGSGAAVRSSPADPWDLNTLSGSSARSGAMGGAGGGNATGGGGTMMMGDSFVNMATMPSGVGGGFVDPQTRTNDWQRSPPAGPEPSSSSAPSLRQGRQTAAYGGDTVLMGSVMPGAGGGGGGGVSAGFGGYGGDTMVNLGTMNLGGGGGNGGSTANFGALPTLPGMKRAPLGGAQSTPQTPAAPSREVR